MRLESLRIRSLGQFRDYSLDLASLGDARVVAITGPNGAGKSTLLELALPGALWRTTPTRGSLTKLATARDAMLEVRVVNGTGAYTIRHLVDPVSGKGESIVMDADGRALIESAKVRDYDRWAALHLPNPDVFFASEFQAQASGGFIDLKPGDRKAVLLRVLQIERYEALAKRARERLTEANGRVDVLRARLTDERQRGGSVEVAQGALAAARAEADRCAIAAAESRIALQDAKAAAADASEMLRTWERRTAEAAKLRASIKDDSAKLAEIEARIANNRGVLDRAAEIREAEAAAAALQARIEERRATITALEAQIAEQRRIRDDEAAAYKRHQEAETAARRRVERAEQRLAEADRIAAAVQDLPAAKDAVAKATGEYGAAVAALNATRGRQLAGADERIGALRVGLQAITTGAPAVHTADATLRADDEVLHQAADLPRKIAAAEAAVGAASENVEKWRASLAGCQRLADRAQDLEAAQAERDEATHLAATAKDAAAVAFERSSEAGVILNRLSAELGPIVADARLDAERLTNVARTAALSTPLAQAEARLAELAPQAAEKRQLIEANTEALAQYADLGTAPTAPDVDAAQRTADSAAAAERTANAAVGVAEQRLAESEASVARATDLLAQIQTEEAEVADWTRLASDLGRDGLQAMEIDAAAPELTTLANDLLHSCVGSRWTVVVETTRLSADGKSQIEGLDVRVIDTVNGRDDLVETYSGGERVMVSEAVSLALTMMACRRAGVDRPTLVRDETGAALDPENARAYVAMLRRAADLIGADRVLFVSHNPDVQELADARVDVSQPVALPAQEAA